MFKTTKLSLQQKRLFFLLLFVNATGYFAWFININELNKKKNLEWSIKVQWPSLPLYLVYYIWATNFMSCFTSPSYQQVNTLSIFHFISNRVGYDSCFTLSPTSCTSDNQIHTYTTPAKLQVDCLKVPYHFLTFKEDSKPVAWFLLKSNAVPIPADSGQVVNPSQS